MMRSLVTVTLLAATLGGPVTSLAQLPDGYTLVAPSQLPDSLREIRIGGRFKIVIARTVRDTVERRLVDVAERLLPPRTAIEQSAARATMPGYIRALAQAAQLPGERWWWHDWDGTLLPYALTGAAAEYYVDRVRSMSVEANPFSAKRSVSVEYKASVDRRPEPGVAYRVHLTLRYELYCGILCGLWFTHTRTVDFDAAGAVLAVRGDGIPSYIMS